MEQVVLRFARGSAGAARLREAIEAVLADPELAGRADLPDRVEVTEEGQGLDPLTVTVAVVLVKLAGRVATDVWDDAIWPRLRRRLDDDALGEPRDE
jgi:hypothetical protein